MSQPTAILFTAFEPSGDALAAPLIRQLRRRDPDCRITALGGPKMADAGAELLEETTQRAVMLGDVWKQYAAHHRRIGLVGQWMRSHRVTAVVPTDSPAANWKVCRITRRLHPDAKIVHLAAPQLWAWAPWRIRRMRRLSDHVMCVLPFEPEWFNQRSMPATFVGHPLFDNDAHPPATNDLPAADGRVKLAILPGSREAEVRKNLPDMLEAVERVHATHGNVAAIVAAGDEPRADQVRQLVSSRSASDAKVAVRVGQTDQVLAWADVGLIVSGTATLDAVKHGLPFLTVYHVNPLMWRLLGRWLVQIRTFTLANLIGQWMGLGRVTPELVPYFGPPARIAEALEPLMTQGAARQTQRRAFEQIRACYANRPFSRAAVDTLLAVIHGTPDCDPQAPAS